MHRRSARASVPSFYRQALTDRHRERIHRQSYSKDKSSKSPISHVPPKIAYFSDKRNLLSGFPRRARFPVRSFRLAHCASQARSAFCLTRKFHRDFLLKKRDSLCHFRQISLIISNKSQEHFQYVDPYCAFRRRLLPFILVSP